MRAPILLRVASCWNHFLMPLPHAFALYALQSCFDGLSSRLV